VRTHKRGPSRFAPKGAEPQEREACLSALGGSTLRASVRFAAALCEISGSILAFLVFSSCVGNDTQRSAFKVWLRGPTPIPLSPYVLGSRQPLIFNRALAMKIERFVGHHEAREALVLSVASVTAIMLTAYLLLLILY